MTTAGRFFPPWTTEVPRWAPAQARFWAGLRFTSPRECWVWIRSNNFNPKADPSVHGTGGYGFFSGGPNGERVYAHRYAWELLRGPIPDGMVIDHLCENKLCCNPDHMQVVTPGENTDRAHRGRRKTVCKYGHPMTGDNVTYYVRPNGRGVTQVCRACRARRNAEYQEKKRREWDERNTDG